IASSMAVAIIPSISASIAIKDKKAANDKMNLAIRLAMIISIPAAFGMGIFASEILKFLFPEAPEGALLLQTGFISVIFFSLSQICTGVLQGLGQLKVPVFSAFLGCLIKIPLNFILISIPSINIVGAIIGTTVCYALAASINAYFAYKYTGSKLDFKAVFLKPIFASIVMSVVCFIAYRLLYMVYPSNSIALMLSIAIGGVVYIFTMFKIKGLTKQDVKFLPIIGRRIN
ncbi:MAG: polysaccharide biosynthesis C-terminal domain-containing protein, partial [Defluviitaleaceae bacterium]|nr:polysaccharide biosynthesis C-terminal domain-containing protein [Defluviitaleaceae bacterium]